MGVLHLPTQHSPHHRGAAAIDRVWRVLLIAAALAAAALPWPGALVERAYSRGMYLAVQPLVTGTTNLVPFAVGDVVLAGLAGWLLWVAWQASVVRPRRRAARLTLWRVALTAAVGWVLFLGLWGLNYRRVPLLEQPGVLVGEVTEADVESLGWLAVERLNALHPVAHRLAWPSDAELVARLASAFSVAQREIGLPRLATPGRPKPTLLGWYFERAAIAGMTNPFGLEVYITPGALPFERPAILAHEWAHLAGLADEADASLFGWIVCRAGDAQTDYSAWLDLYSRVVSAVGAEPRRAMTAALDAGPRDDLRAVAARFARVSPRVRRVAWEGYDRYLRAQGIAGGIASYDRFVVRLLQSRWRPARVPQPGTSPCTRPMPPPTSP